MANGDLKLLGSKTSLGKILVCLDQQLSEVVSKKLKN